MKYSQILLILNIILFSNINYSIAPWERMDTNGTIFPWYAPKLCQKLKSLDTKKWNVFEWRWYRGSTIWWAKNCNHITTIEPKNISQNLKKCNLESRLQKLNINDNKKIISKITYKLRNIKLITYYNKLFKKQMSRNIRSNYGENSDYVNAIHENNNFYDCIIIDGPHTNACAIAALKHIKKNGIIILNHTNDDFAGMNSEPIITLLQKYKRYSYKHSNQYSHWYTDYWIIN